MARTTITSDTPGTTNPGEGIHTLSIFVNNKAGVLILSDTTGAHEQLWRGAVSVTPTDIYGTMEALYQSLTMPQEEREHRANGLKDAIGNSDITHWLSSQLRDIYEISAQR